MKAANTVSSGALRRGIIKGLLQNENSATALWYARLESNQRPLESESNALSNSAAFLDGYAIRKLAAAGRRKT